MKFLITLTVLAAVALSSSSIVKSPASSGDNFELLILHNNDMHARFEQTSQVSNVCTTADREAGKCYGGFPRVAHVVKQARAAAASGQGPPVLYLNAGDTYTGTAWFTIYKWKIAAEFINALQPDAVSLGNSEFENGSEELSPFLNNINTKILASNVILKSAENNEKFQKSVVFDIKGVKVGLVGYLTPEAKILDITGNVEYVDEVIALQEEVAKLQEQGVYIIIALGHSDINKDVEIAKEVDGIDLVIAGNKNTFYWNGTSTANSETITVTQQSGKQVPVIQSSAYDKYLGRLVATFNKDGDIIQYNVDPILLDDSISQEAEALQIVKNYKEQVTQRLETVIGQSSVILDGDTCKVEECNLGNFITDAMMYYHAIRHESDPWTDAPVAIIHGGAIAASVSPSNRPASVTHGDLQAALPLESNVVVVTMSGTILNQVIEHSVSDYSQQNPSGQFLQYSGIRVVYDLSKESGSRVVSAVVRCGSCYVPEYYVIDDWRTYKLLMPEALADGEFGYSMLVGLERENADFDELTSTTSFLDMRSPVYPEVAGRIILQNVQPEVPDSATRLSCSLLFIVLLSFVMS